LKNVYNVKKNPKYLNGELTEEQCLQKFLNSFEVGHHKDGIVTYDEFVQYYAGIYESLRKNKIIR
jgi:calcyphosin